MHTVSSAQEAKRLAKEREVSAKLAARTLTKEYLSSLQEQVLWRLSRAGMFEDPLVQEIEHSFMPWLADAVRVTGVSDGFDVKIDGLDFERFDN